MAFRTLALCISLALTATCYNIADEYYTSLAKIEEFSASSYAAVSPNYHLAKLQCTGCPRKLSLPYNSEEYLVLNFSATPDAVLLNGKQIYPATDPAPEIFVHQVSGYIDLRMFDYDYLNYYRYDIPFYPLSRLGYVVNVTSQAHPPGSSDSTSSTSSSSASASASLVTLDFRIIQVGPTVLDCLDSVVLTMLRTASDGASMVKGARFVQNEESYLPNTDDDDDSIDAYAPKAVVTTSGLRKCHPSAKEIAAQRPSDRCYEYYSCPTCSCPRRFNRVELLAIVLASLVLGAGIALLAVYSRAGLQKGASRMASVVRCCAVGVSGRLRGGRGGAIQLPTSVKKDMEDSEEQ